ncbi:S26 family signal peptidase [Nocardioides sp. B-3]|nr:S26 family signal peptidase [Nocardioides sp. B-3]
MIGLPGDSVSVETPQGDRPTVLVRPADGSGTFTVNNPRWRGRVGTRVLGCCSSDGSAGKRSQTRWSTVPDDSYWVIGDNWGGSDDSRTYGFMKTSDIRGVAIWRLTPLPSFGLLENADISLDPAP